LPLLAKKKKVAFDEPTQWHTTIRKRPFCFSLFVARLKVTRILETREIRHPRKKRPASLI
jgi:hypothetical protein